LSIAKALLAPNTAKTISNNEVLRMFVPLNRGKTGMRMEANWGCQIHPVTAPVFEQDIYAIFVKIF
jgi:hypothetical protein